MKNQKVNEEQLSLFAEKDLDSKDRRVRELDQTISDSLKSSDIIAAKEAAKRQEALLKKIIEEKKTRP